MVTDNDDDVRWRPKRRGLKRAPIDWARVRAAPVSFLVCLAALGASVGVLTAHGPIADAYDHWGHAPAQVIWAGNRWWSLCSSALLHADPLHLLFNLYWFWCIGSVLEPRFTRWRSFAFLGFVLCGAATASAFQLALSGDTGVGLSGVVYALLGYALLARRHDPALRAVVDKRVLWIFAVWLVGCVVVTQLGLWRVGNAAHVSGLLLGVLLGAASTAPSAWQRALARGANVLVVAAAISCLLWAPWSTHWLSAKAYEAHTREHYPEAIAFYSRVIAANPGDAWALTNRASARLSTGDRAGAEADELAARQIEARAAKPH